jgi:type I restriction enzyme S subunit
MGTVADLVTTQYGYTEIATEEKVGPKFLRITDIVGSQIDWNSVPHCPITESEYKKYQLKEGDIVVSRTGANIGYAKQIRGIIPEAVYASFLVRLKPNDGIYNWYLGLSVDSQEYKDFIFANQQGSAQPQANANIMGQYPLAIPEKEIVKKFNALVSPILRTISLHQEEINKLNEMKPLLLSKMGV